MVEERDNYVYIVEADPEAVARAVRRLQILVLTIIPIVLIGMCLAVVLRSLTGDSPPLSSFLPGLLIMLAVPALVAYLVVPRCIKKTEVMIGEDFILAPIITFPSSTVVVKYEDILRARLDVSQGRIVGATIGAKGLDVCTGRIKDPAVVVRAVFDRTSDKIRWHRSRRPFSRLSRDDVKELIERSQASSLEELLPPSVTLARADDLFPKRKGFLGRLSGREAPATWKGFSSERPTAVSRYVNLMLLRMFEDGSTLRVLRQSEQLPILALASQTAEPPALEDVLNRLKIMCRLDPHADSAVIHGTVDVTINRTPCKLLCRFDNNSDACCQIRLERLAE
jgi:hypothetical protein